MSTNSFRYKELGKNTAIFAIASFSTKLISFFLVPIYTNVLTTSQFGVIEIILNLLNLLVPVFSLSISEAVLRFGLEKNANNKDILKSTFLVLFIASVVELLLTPVFGLYSSIGNWCFFFSAICVLQMVRGVVCIYLKTINKTGLFAIDSIVYSFILAGLSVLMVALLKLGIFGYFLAYVIAESFSILFVIVVGKLYKHIISGKINFALLKPMLRYSIPLIVSSLAWWIITFSDKIMIGHFQNEASVGIYSVATRIPTLLSAILSIFIQAWNLTSVGSYSENEGKGVFFEKTFKYYSLLMLFFSWAIIFISRIFMKVYVGADFQESVYFVPLLILASTFLMIAWFFGPIYNAEKKTVMATITVILSAVVNIIANLLLIPLIGILGAVYATVFAYLVLAFIRLFDTRRFFKFKIDFFTLIVSFILIIAESFIFTYADGAFKYKISLVTLLLLLIFNWKEISCFLRDIKILLAKRLKNRGK